MKLWNRYFDRKKLCIKLLLSPDDSRIRSRFLTNPQDLTSNQIRKGILQREPRNHSRLRVLWHWLVNYQPSMIFSFLATSFGIREYTLLCFYLGLNLLITCINPHSYQINSVTAILQGDELANRFGYMALGNTFFIFLTACRNTLLSQLTSYSFEHYITFHRWIGRVIFIFAFLHGVTHLAQAGTYGSPLQLFKTKRNLYGLIGLLSLALILLSSLNYVRRKYFRTFYYSHFLFLVFIVFLILHSDDSYIFVLPGFVLYSLDRIQRAYRSNSSSGRLVKFKPLPDHVVRLEIEHADVSRSYQSGQYVFLNIPRIQPLRLDWHPFTISSWPSDRISNDPKTKNTFTVHIKALGDMTQQLVRLLESLGDKETIQIKVDGPYGLPCASNIHHSLLDYPVALLISGGIGVTPMLSLLGELINRMERGKSYFCDTLYFVWTIRTKDQYEWVRKELGDLVRMFRRLNSQARALSTSSPNVKLGHLREYTLHIQIYVTKETIKSMETDTLGLIQFYEGRPNLNELMTSIRTANPTSKDVGLCVCGPPEMVRDVRKAVADGSKVDCLFHLYWDSFLL